MNRGLHGFPGSKTPNTLVKQGDLSPSRWDYIVECRRNSGANDGASVAGSWQDRTLNREMKPAGWAALQGDNIRVLFLPNVLDFEWDCPLYNSGRVQSRLFNVTDGIVIGLGTSERSNVATGLKSLGFASDIRFTKPTMLKLQTFVSNSDGSGLGEYAGTGLDEVFCRLRVKKTG